MIRKVLYATLASAALMVGAARATETIVWWDFLSGGDGVRMKAMLDEFNKEHAGKVHIDATTLGMGHPVLHQGADRGRDGPGSRRHDLPRIAHAARRVGGGAERTQA